MPTKAAGLQFHMFEYNKVVNISAFLALQIQSDSHYQKHAKWSVLSWICSQFNEYIPVCIYCDKSSDSSQ